jgi:uncharacterized membrane protein HdeD (DUF308 family)
MRKDDHYLRLEDEMSTMTHDHFNIFGSSDAKNAVLANNWWLLALRGLAGIIFGLIALIVPGITLFALVMLFAAYMLVDGVFAIVSAMRAARRNERWGLIALDGLARIGTGVVAFVWPGITAVAFVLLIGAWTIVSGCLMLGAAYNLAKDYGRWWLGLAGALSIVYGVMLVLVPPAGAISLTMLLGAYSLVFGAIIIALAIKLRSRHLDHGSGKTANAAT